MLQMALGVPLMSTKGWGSPESERIFTRARELCQQLGETPELFGVLWGLWGFHCSGRSELQTALELAEQLVRLAQHQDDATLLRVAAYGALANTLFFLGELPAACGYFEQVIAAYDPQRHHSWSVQLAGLDAGVTIRLYLAFSLWSLGFPDQALKRSAEALTLAQELAHSMSWTLALQFTARVHTLRGEGYATLERAEAAMRLSTELGSTLLLAWSTAHQGWALGAQGQPERGIEQLCESLAICRAAGAESWVPYCLALLAETQAKAGQVTEGLSTLAETLETTNRRGDRWYEAELYRLKGELTLKQSQVQGPKFQVPNTQHLPPSPQAEAEAETCFQKALEIAQRQQAKSLELRAGMSLSRLWQQQGKKDEARQMLAEIYGWFTEGFDTKDLQEAKALLEELS
jgi:predicted ATPase